MVAACRKARTLIGSLRWFRFRAVELSLDSRSEAGSHLALAADHARGTRDIRGGRERDHFAGSPQFVASAGLLSGGSAVVSSDSAPALGFNCGMLDDPGIFCYNTPQIRNNAPTSRLLVPVQ
jgi:hypothetical protein